MSHFLKLVNKFRLKKAEILRQNIIELLDLILTRSEKDFIPIVPELCSMIGKLLNDQCIIRLSAKLGKVIGPHTKGISNSLSLNLKHSHNKIRKITLQVQFNITLLGFR